METRVKGSEDMRTWPILLLGDSRDDNIRKQRRHSGSGSRWSLELQTLSQNEPQLFRCPSAACAFLAANTRPPIFRFPHPARLPIHMRPPTTAPLFGISAAP